MNYVSVYMSIEISAFGLCGSYLGAELLDNVQRVVDFGALSPKMDVLIKPLPSKCRGLCRRGGRKIVKARGDG